MNKRLQPISTERLILREFQLSDAVNIYNLNSDPEVIQYTGDVCFESIAAALTFLEGYKHYELFGYGRWAVIEKSSSEFLGWCGLKYISDIQETDIGYRFFKKYWNMGFATESAKACIDLGFDHFGLTTIVGRSMKVNLASVAVLKKIGLSYWKDCDFDGQEGVYYKIERNT